MTTTVSVPSTPALTTASKSPLFDSAASPPENRPVVTLTDSTSVSTGNTTSVGELLSRLSKTLRKDPKHRKTNGAFGGRAKVSR